MPAAACCELLLECILKSHGRCCMVVRRRRLRGHIWGRLVAAFALLPSAPGNVPAIDSAPQPTDAGVVSSHGRHLFPASTALSLQWGVTSGARHIVVERHISLLDLGLTDCNNDTQRTALDPVLCMQPATVTLTGNCTDEPPMAITGQAIEKLTDYQCVVKNDQRLALGIYQVHQRLLISHLYLQTVRTNGVMETVVPVLSLDPRDLEMPARPRVYLNYVTLQGDGQKMADAIWVKGRSKLLAYHCEISDFSGTDGPALAIDSSTASLIGVGITGCSSMSGAVFVGASQGFIAALRLENCSFSANSPSDVAMRTGTKVRADDTAAMVINVDTQQSQDADPLADDEGVFLSPTEEWYRAMTQEVAVWLEDVGPRSSPPPTSPGGLSNPPPAFGSPNVDLRQMEGRTETSGRSSPSVTRQVLIGSGVVLVVVCVMFVAAIWKRSMSKAATRSLQNRHSCATWTTHSSVLTDSQKSRSLVPNGLTTFSSIYSNANVGFMSPQAHSPDAAVTRAAEQIQPVFKVSASLDVTSVNPYLDFLLMPCSITPFATMQFKTDGYDSASATKGTVNVLSRLAEDLADALDDMESNGKLFLDTYILLGAAERRMGGQGLVQFVFHQQSRMEYAVKFFLTTKTFQVEREMYMNHQLRDLMPAICHVCDNQDGSVRTKRGYCFPPFIIVERGQSLEEWMKYIRHDFITIVQALLHIAQRLQLLHMTNLAHRDIKPGNVLRLPRLHAWTLMDFGCTARIGSRATVMLTLRYAAPELVQLVESREPYVTVSPASDIWALGIMAFEMLTGRPAFRLEATFQEICDRILGRLPMPWEERSGSEDVQAYMRLCLRGLRGTILQCLHRDPSMRPTAGALVSAWDKLFEVSTLEADISHGDSRHRGSNAV